MQRKKEIMMVFATQIEAEICLKQMFGHSKWVWNKAAYYTCCLMDRPFRLRVLVSQCSIESIDKMLINALGRFTRIDHIIFAGLCGSLSRACKKGSVAYTLLYREQDKLEPNQVQSIQDPMVLQLLKNKSVGLFDEVFSSCTPIDSLAHKSAVFAALSMQAYDYLGLSEDRAKALLLDIKHASLRKPSSISSLKVVCSQDQEKNMLMSKWKDDFSANSLKEQNKNASKASLQILGRIKCLGLFKKSYLKLGLKKQVQKQITKHYTQALFAYVEYLSLAITSVEEDQDAQNSAVYSKVPQLSLLDPPQQ